MFFQLGESPRKGRLEVTYLYKSLGNNPAKWITWVFMTRYLPYVLKGLAETGVALALSQGKVQIDQFGLEKDRLHMLFRFLQSVQFLETDGRFWWLSRHARPALMWAISQNRYPTSTASSSQNYFLAVCEYQKLVPALVNMVQSGCISVTGREVSISPLEADDSDFAYLTQLGWVSEGQATKLGQKVLSRIYDIATYSAYYPYLDEIARWLRDRSFDPKRNFRLDTTGSGGMGNRLYFERVKDHITAAYQADEIEALVDIGAGNGQFLELVESWCPGIKLLGIEFEEEAQRNFNDRMRKAGQSSRCEQGDITTPLETVKLLESRDIDPKKTMVSSWFIVQEVLGQRDVALGSLSQTYREKFHSFLIGEMFAQDMKTLRKTARTVPQACIDLANAMSGQVLLPQKTFQIEVRQHCGVELWDTFGSMSRGLKGEELSRFVVTVLRGAPQRTNMF